jgi:hypothetical protein
MKSFYSILQVPTRPAGQEIVNLGLLLIGDQESYFRFSNRKLEFVKKLIPENPFALLQSYLFGLSEKIKMDDELLQTKFKSTEFVTYLANYNNNLITFSKPTPIDLEANEKTYQLLFEKFIFTYEEDTQSETAVQVVSLQNHLKKTLYPRIKHRVNLNQILTTREIPTLLVPSVKVNFIGQNNIPVAGQAVDFEKSTDQITNNVSRLISLIKAFELEHENKGQYYIIGKEPDKKNYKEQHDNWQHIKSSSLIEFVDIDETEKISQYIEKHDVRPFIDNN